MFDKNGGLLGAIACASVGLLIGGLIGHFGTTSVTEEDRERITTYQKLIEDKWASETDVTQMILDLISTTNLRNNLKELSRKPHLAGTARDDELAMLIHQRFMEAGFDTAELVPYEVLLSYPNHTNPNLITIMDSSQKVVFTSKFKEEALHEDDEDPEFVHAFNGYSAAGDVTTQPGVGVIYVNYGRVEDFEKLEELGIDVAGHVVMARYGKIFRGNKLLHAEQRNASGVILFSDPKDVALNGTDPKDVYPNSFWLPGSGMQRGGTYTIKGDPLTPGWPSTKHAYRLDESEVPLPKIPCQPIGYDDARVIMEKMGGKVPPADWVGGMKGIKYNLGPEMLNEYKDYTLRLQTNNFLRSVNSYNVIGTIKGSTEPDRYVLIGNHRDAWGYGAVDPSSGTAQLLETGRVFGQLLKKGWRPRRTLVFCSWGAEEYGLIGSTEWVEEHLEKLQERAVLYLNTDSCAAGSILTPSSSPLIWDPLVKLTKMVPGVREGKTLYDEWEAYHLARNRSSPELKTLGSGSDHAPFAFYGGIPSLNVVFRMDSNKHGIYTHPTYHTGFETFYLVDTFVDPGFKIMQGCGRLAALFLKYFADSALIPYSLQQMSTVIEESLNKVKDKGKGATLLEIYDKFPLLEESAHNFTAATAIFAQKLDSVKDTLDPVMLRAINDQMMKLEQVFIMPTGLPGRPTIRHAIFAPSQFDNYAAAGFPGISDLLYRIDDLQGEELSKRHKEIRRHISDLTILLQKASGLLEDFNII
ncbi:N-acetylated-alpha-linked acidic dipeptidase 2-like [Macrobrachium nipponense]|uniref:N-acetylated-alpha-linked acidic dipeptidase 2-like n=1 Tax=Macrobrachium nipponense TaxID=159736 RepID=UPI0030C8A594